MVRCIASVIIVLVNAYCVLGGDYGDPLPLNKRVAVLEQKVAELEKKLASIGKPEQVGFDPVLPGTVQQPAQVLSAPVQYQQCVNGVCAPVQYQPQVQYQRPGLFGRVFNR